MSAPPPLPAHPPTLPSTPPTPFLAPPTHPPTSLTPPTSSTTTPPTLPFSSPLNAPFILLAEFDILKGSQLRLQYPQPTGVREGALAEWMLPEGAHLRESDWTVFFLTQRMVRKEQEERLERDKKDRDKAERKAQRDRVAAEATTAAAAPSTLDPQLSQEASVPSSSSTPPPPSDASSATQPLSSSNPTPSPLPSASSSLLPPLPPPSSDDDLLCVLNLCRTKYDKGVKRGAMVKSLAVVTRHRFYNALKPVLMLALDAIFDVAPIAASSVLSPVAGHTTTAPLAGVGGGAGGDEEVLGIVKELYATINAVAFPASLTSPMSLLQLSLLTSAPPSPAPAPSPPPLTLTFLSTSFPLRLPPHLLPSEVLESSLTSLCARFGPSTMDVFTALLTCRRVLFLAYQQPASSVTSMVLSSLLLISPPFPSLLYRAFPYTSLTNMDFLDTPGYVAGVTNPIFQQRHQWWDVLCDVSEGTVTLSPAYEAELARGGGGGGGGGVAAGDGAFWQEVAYGLQLKYGEEWLRGMFRDYTAWLLSCVQDVAAFPDLPTRTAVLEAQQTRINAVLRSTTYQQWMTARLRPPSSSSSPSSASSPSPLTLDRLARHAQTLQHRTPSTPELLSLLTDLHSLLSSSSTSSSPSPPFLSPSSPNTPSATALQHFLTLCPDSQGGLMCVAQYLLHREAKVREEVVRLLRLLDEDEDGKRWVGGLNYFLLMTYYRERGDGGGGGGAGGGGVLGEGVGVGGGDETEDDGREGVDEGEEESEGGGSVSTHESSQSAEGMHARSVHE